MKKPRTAITVGAWNTHQASRRRLRRFARKCKKRGDLFVVLTEVMRRHRELGAIAENVGWDLLMEAPVRGSADLAPEHGDTAVLVSPDFHVTGWEVVPMEKEWTVFSHKQKHAGRRLIIVRGWLEVPGWFGLSTTRLDVKFLAVHGPTSGNTAAVAEFLWFVERFLARTHDDVLAIVAGDGNFRLSDDDIRAMIRRLGARADGQGPDTVLVTGADVDTKKGRRSGSDHYKVVHTIAADAQALAEAVRGRRRFRRLFGRH